MNKTKPLEEQPVEVRVRGWLINDPCNERGINVKHIAKIYLEQYRTDNRWYVWCRLITGDEMVVSEAFKSRQAAETQQKKIIEMYHHAEEKSGE